MEFESLGVVITIEGATGFPLKLDSLEQRATHTRPRLADRCRPAPAPTQPESTEGFPFGGPGVWVGVVRGVCSG